jgi:hypothetical protein
MPPCGPMLAGPGGLIGANLPRWTLPLWTLCVYQSYNFGTWFPAWLKVSSPVTDRVVCQVKQHSLRPGYLSVHSCASHRPCSSAPHRACLKLKSSRCTPERAWACLARSGVHSCASHHLPPVLRSHRALMIFHVRRDATQQKKGPHHLFMRQTNGAMVRPFLNATNKWQLHWLMQLRAASTRVRKHAPHDAPHHGASMLAASMQACIAPHHGASMQACMGCTTPWRKHAWCKHAPHKWTIKNGC